jgi:large subunit ribosomal protein L9
VAWSRGGEKQIDSIKAARTARELATLEEAQTLKAKLEGTPVKLTVKAGREGRLFGSVKTADIADAVAAAGLGQVDKRTIELGSAIKGVGRYDATIRLREDVIAALTIEVVAAK